MHVHERREIARSQVEKNLVDGQVGSVVGGERLRYRLIDTSNQANWNVEFASSPSFSLAKAVCCNFGRLLLLCGNKVSSSHMLLTLLSHLRRTRRPDSAKTDLPRTP